MAILLNNVKVTYETTVMLYHGLSLLDAYNLSRKLRKFPSLTQAEAKVIPNEIAWPSQDTGVHVYLQVIDAIVNLPHSQENKAIALDFQGSLPFQAAVTVSQENE